jgi:hypothetical protein
MQAPARMALHMAGKGRHASSSTRGKGLSTKHHPRLAQRLHLQRGPVGVTLHHAGQCVGRSVGGMGGDQVATCGLEGTSQFAQASC